MRNVVGIGLVGDSKSFVRSIDSAARSVVSMNHYVGQGERMLGHFQTRASATTATLEKLRSSLLKLQVAQYNLTLSKENIRRYGDNKNRRRYLLDGIKQHQSILDAETLQDRMAAKSAATFRAAGFAAAGSFVAGFVSFGISDKIVGAIKESVVESSKFQKELYKTAFVAQMPVGGAEFNRMKKAATKVAMKSMFAPDEVGKAFYELLTTGLNKEQAHKALQPLTDLVTASFGDIDLKQGAWMMGVSNAKLKIPKEVREAGKEFEYLADMFTKLTHVAPGTIKDIIPTLQSMQNASKELSMTLEDQMNFIAALKLAGYNPRRVGQKVDQFAPGMVQAMRDFSGIFAGKGGKGRIPLWEILGVDRSFFERNGKRRPEVDILFDIAGRLKAIDGSLQPVLDSEGNVEKYIRLTADEAARAVFTNKSQATLLSILSSFEYNGKVGLDAFNELRAAFADRNGVARKGAEQYLKTWEGITKLIEGVWQTIVIVFGEPLLNLMQPIAESFRNMLEKLADFFYDNPRLTKFLSYMALALSIFTGIAGVVLVISGVVWAIVAAMAYFGVTIAAILPVLVAAGATMSVISIAAGIFALAMYKAFKQGNLVPALRSLGSIKEMVSTIAQAFSELGSNKDEWFVSEDTARKLESLGIWEAFKTLLNIFEGLKVAAKSFYAGLKPRFALPAITRFFDRIVKLIQSISGSYKDASVNSEDFWKEVGSTVAYGANQMIKAIGAVIEALTLFIDIMIILATDKAPEFSMAIKLTLIAVSLLTAGIIVLAGTMLVLLAFAFGTVGAIMFSLVFAIFFAYNLILGVWNEIVGLFEWAAGYNAGYEFGASLSSGFQKGIAPLIDIMSWLGSNMFGSKSEVFSNIIGTGTADNVVSIANANAKSAAMYPVPTPANQGAKGGSGNGQTNNTKNTDININMNNTINGGLQTPEEMGAFVKMLAKLMKQELSNELLNEYGYG